MIVSGVVGSRAGSLDPAACLSASELRRFHSLDGQARIDLLAGRVALKDAVRRHAGQLELELCGLCVANDGEGRPLLPGHPDLHCSLAHSGGWGVGAVSGFPVGIDIERIRPRSGELLRYIAEDAEVELVASGCATDQECLVTLWAIKEAVLKAIGVGLHVPPRDVRVLRRAGRTFTVDVPDGNIRSAWNVQTSKVEDMLISVATKGCHDEPLRINWY